MGRGRTWSVGEEKGLRENPVAWSACGRSRWSLVHPSPRLGPTSSYMRDQLGRGQAKTTPQMPVGEGVSCLGTLPETEGMARLAEKVVQHGIRGLSVAHKVPILSALVPHPPAIIEEKPIWTSWRAWLRRHGFHASNTV